MNLRNCVGAGSITDAANFRLSATKNISRFSRRAFILAVPTMRDLRIIDGFTLSDGRCAVHGKFAKILLEHHVIYPTATLSGNPERALRRLVKENGNRERAACRQDFFGEDINERITGGSLFDWALKTTKKYEFSFDIEYNFDSEQSELVI